MVNNCGNCARKPIHYINIDTPNTSYTMYNNYVTMVDIVLYISIR